MLETYVVRIKNVKVGSGTKTYLNYLNNDNHKNHTKHNTKIIPLGYYNSVGSEKEFASQQKYKFLMNKKNYELNGKGGRKLEVQGKSLTFNIPVEFNPTIEQTKQIYKEVFEVVRGIYERKGFILEENEIYSNLHIQKNNHINMFIPYLDLFGNTIRFVKEDSFIQEVRREFTKIVDNKLNKSIHKYKPLSVEQQKYNKTIRFLKSLRGGYEIELDNGLLNEKETKYIKNQIVSIDRLLNENNKLDKIKNDSNLDLKTKEDKISMVEKIITKNFERIEINSRKYSINREEQGKTTKLPDWSKF